MLLHLYVKLCDFHFIAFHFNFAKHKSKRTLKYIFLFFFFNFFGLNASVLCIRRHVSYIIIINNTNYNYSYIVKHKLLINGISNI